VLFLGGLLGLLLGVATLFVARIIAPSLFPKQGGFHFGFYVGSLPTGPDGTFARRDHVRTALRSLAGAATCFGVSVAAVWLGSRPSSTVVEQLVLGVTFFFVLLGALSVAAALLSLWKAAFWRPVHLASDWPRGSEYE
jgi:hypothetical protein